MKKLIIITLFMIAMISLNAEKYAGEIFQISPGVQNQAMGNTGLTYSSSLAEGWWNPALLAISDDNGVEVMRVEHFEGLMQQNQFSVIFGSKTRTSLQLNHLGIDKIKLTELENPDEELSNDNRPQIWKTVSNNDLIFTLGLGRSIKNNLHLGLSPKLAYRSLAENNGFGIGADLGILWEPLNGFKVGANLRDCFSTQIIWENGTYEIALPNLDVEAGYDFSVFSHKIPFHTALRTQIYAEDRGDASTVSAGPMSADFHFGMMAQPIPTLKVMAGWDIDSFTAGLGINYKNIGIDYAWVNGSPDALGSSQRLSLNYKW